MHRAIFSLIHSYDQKQSIAVFADKTAAALCRKENLWQKTTIILCQLLRRKATIQATSKNFIRSSTAKKQDPQTSRTELSTTASGSKKTLTESARRACPPITPQTHPQADPPLPILRSSPLSIKAQIKAPEKRPAMKDSRSPARSERPR